MKKHAKRIIFILLSLISFFCLILWLSACLFAEYMSVKLKIRRVTAVALGIFGMIMYIATYTYSQYFPAAYRLPHGICF